MVRIKVITNETKTEMIEITNAFPQSVSKYLLTKYNQITSWIKLIIIPSMKTVSKIIFTIIPKVVIKSASENFALCSPTIDFPEYQRDGAVIIVPEMSSTIICNQSIATV